MPPRTAKPCGWPACNVLVRGASYCDAHQHLADAKRLNHRKTVHERYNAKRDESDAFYKTERWKKLSAYYRRVHPVCEECDSAASEITDHIKAFKLNPDLALDWNNLRALCRRCHNQVGERVGLIYSPSSRT